MHLYRYVPHVLSSRYNVVEYCAVVHAVCQANPEISGCQLNIIEEGLNFLRVILEIHCTDNQSKCSILRT